MHAGVSHSKLTPHHLTSSLTPYPVFPLLLSIICPFCPSSFAFLSLLFYPSSSVCITCSFSHNPTSCLLYCYHSHFCTFTFLLCPLLAIGSALFHLFPSLLCFLYSVHSSVLNFHSCYPFSSSLSLPYPPSTLPLCPLAD